jgi:hypothetical protein
MFSQIRSLSYLIYRDFPVPQITPKLATVLIAAKVFTGFHEYRSIYFILIRQLKYFNVYQDQYINYPTVGQIRTDTPDYGQYST